MSTTAAAVVPAVPFALDYGGTLIKLVYYSAADDPSLPNTLKRPRLEAGGVVDGNLCAKQFPSDAPELCVKYVQKHVVLPHLARGKDAPALQVPCTGGGVHRNDVRTLFRTVLNVELVPLDELSCLIRGLNAMLFLRPRQLLFMYQAESENKTRFIEAEGIYPYLLVNCGSGVSVLLVTGPGEFSRVSGSSLGGGTLLGVCRLLTGIESFDTLMQVGQSGNPDNVDLLVQDIYGGDYTQMGLPGNLLASSMGKAHAGCQYNKSDLVAALVRMVGINVAQVGFLNAKVHGVRRVIYTGFLVRDRPEIWERISYGFNFWSKSTLDAVYVSYDGFLGAQGAFVHQFVSNGPSPGASPDADRRARDTHAPAAAAASAAGASVSVASTPSGAAASSHAQASASPAKSSAKRTS